MIKGYKIRLYPTKEQEALMWKHVHACRFIYNYMLERQNLSYVGAHRYMSRFDMINCLKPIKNDGVHNWLYNVSAVSLQTTCDDLWRACTNHSLGRAGPPRFKTKKTAKPQFPVDDSRIWFDDTCHVHIIKIGKVRYKTDFSLPCGRLATIITNPRVTYKDEKWMLSFGLECENQTFHLNDYSMGVDLGLKSSVVAAYSNQKVSLPNINKSKAIRDTEKRIRYTQRSISRKYEANKQGREYTKTRNIEREEAKLKGLYARLHNLRINYIHQSTHALVELLPKRIVMEDLNISGMLTNSRLSKAVRDQCFAEWVRQMKYKCEWRGIEFIQVARFYPSSKTCHNCGCIKHNLQLGDRTFICPDCGYTEDRDYNAALNLMSYVG